MDTPVHPPDVDSLHYEFDGWPGDDLLESFPCFIISEKLKEMIGESELTGYEIGDVTVSKSETFTELHPERELPDFYWLKIVGEPATDDFGLSEDHHLTVSQEALSVLQDANIAHAEREACQPSG